MVINLCITPRKNTSQYGQKLITNACLFLHRTSSNNLNVKVKVLRIIPVVLYYMLHFSKPIKPNNVTILTLTKLITSMVKLSRNWAEQKLIQGTVP